LRRGLRRIEFRMQPLHVGDEEVTGGKFLGFAASRAGIVERFDARSQLATAASDSCRRVECVSRTIFGRHGESERPALLVLWFAAEGHRRYRAFKRPWYTKVHASFADMLARLPRETIRERVFSLPLTGPGSRKITQALENIAALAA
jgi:hypothetical protein